MLSRTAVGHFFFSDITQTLDAGSADQPIHYDLANQNHELSQPHRPRLAIPKSLSSLD